LPHIHRDQGWGALVLTRRQETAWSVLSGPQRNTMLVGGSRSGKTTVACAAVLGRAKKATGSRHLIARFRMNACWKSIGLETLPLVARRMSIPIKRRAEYYFTLPEHRVGSAFEASEIWLSGLDEKERLEQILGKEYATLYKNEASQIPYASSVVLDTRLAQKIDGLKQRSITDLNPTGKTHWTHRLFIEKVDPITRIRIPDPEEYAFLAMNPEDNRENLTPEYLRVLDNLPERQRKRFYEGSYVDEIDNALWSFEMIERVRIDGVDPSLIAPIARGDIQDERMPAMQRVVVAIDPSGTAGKESDRSDNVGVSVAGLGKDGRGYLLADRTCNLPPAGWANIAVTAYHEFAADRIVAEKNFGGAMVESTIRAADPNVPIKMVVASRGKAVRAEPISAFYDPKIDKVRHVGRMPELEDQLCSFSTAGYMGDRSPDRADAAIWALTDLLGVNPGDGLGFFEYMRRQHEAMLAAKAAHEAARAI
jgi:hypothetical protein